jgi:hypothetical protein
MPSQPPSRPITTTPIAEVSGLDDETLRREVIAGARPTILRGLVKHWPAVRHGLVSPLALAQYLADHDNGSQVQAVMTPPDQHGRLFYNADMSGFNFMRNQLPLSTVLEQVLRYSAFPNPPAVAVQSSPIPDCLPGFVDENPLPLLGQRIVPRIWLGNALTTPAHFDESSNIACVVAGRRRFTLFPPEQIGNLYIGPLDHAPTGTPISLVNFAAPDVERFPRFREAVAAAQVAELDPGDAILIPALWWHHVESLAGFNMLVNYWWRGALAMDDPVPSALDSLLHALMCLKSLPAEERRSWGAIFEHYVFDAGRDAAAHIPANRRGALGEMTPELRERLRALLKERMR